VPESADAERVIRDMAAQGNKLIFGTTFGYMEPMLKVAADTKGVNFQHATGYKTAENMSTYDSRTYEGAYMAGVIAGKMTKSNTLGVVASVPIPEVIRNINSFTLGAQSSNPKVKTKVVWVNEWFNPPKETEAATSLINGGADVLFQNTDSPAVLKTAQDKGKRAFGWDSDMTAYGPKAHLASAVINWGPYYIKATKDALEGKNASTQSWWGVKEGAIDIVSIAEDVPAETKAKVEEVKKGLADGSFVIWKGPIVDNTGKEQLAKDAVADDKFLGGLNFTSRAWKARSLAANKRECTPPHVGRVFGRAGLCRANARQFFCPWFPTDLHHQIQRAHTQGGRPHGRCLRGIGLPAPVAPSGPYTYRFAGVGPMVAVSRSTP
jgi:basic membrane protein A